MLFTRAPFMRIYQDFGVDLPLVTSIAMNIWAFIAVGLLLAATVAKERVIKNLSVVRN
jgi:type II secretory pathway component PulF